MTPQGWLSQLNKSLLSMLLATLLTLTIPWLAMAATITVNTTTDELSAGNGNCSLREAIMNANNNNNTYSECGTGAAGMDTINVPTGIYTLTRTGTGEDFNGTGDLDVLTDTAGILLNGTGATSASVVLDANGIDRVIHAASGVALHVNNLTIRRGNLTVGRGGGAYFEGTAMVTGTTFISNTTNGSGIGGGACFEGTASVTGTTFVSNTTNGSGSGGGAYFVSTVYVTGTTFTSNTTNGEGGGAWFHNTANVAGTTFMSNTTGSFGVGGGAVFFDSTANITGTIFSGNTAFRGGGAVFGSTANVTGTTFSGNSASNIGGGVYFIGYNPVQLVNVLFARNWASSQGAAVYVQNASPLRLIHTTIVSPTAPTGGTQAVYVGGGTVYLTNTIIASHTTGIERAGGTVVENYNLFTPGSTPFAGTVGHGTNNSITGTVAFGDETTYQLSSASAAVDAGTNAGITTDYFGTTRPQGSGYDLGYAEYTPVSVCFATPNDGTTVYSSSTASAVRSALGAVSAGGTVKVAGYCKGVANQSGTNQVTLITQSITLAGGYTTTNWSAYNPTGNPTTLDAQGAGRVIKADVAATLQGFTATNGVNTNGGGLYALGALTLTQMTVYSNRATSGGGSGGGGGAFFGGTATVTGTAFMSNTASNFTGVGGGARFQSTAYVTGTTFSGNTANLSGGGAYFQSTANVMGTTFSGNTTSSPGGGAYFAGTADVMGTAFSGNTANGGGGAYFGGTANVTGTTFSGNISIGNNGGGAMFSNIASITGTTFSGNKGASYGGGAFFFDTTYVTGTTFSDNTVTADGGGVYFNNASPMQLVNVLFARNWATNLGAAVYVSNASPLRLIHTTIVSPSVGGTAIIVGGGTVYLTNTIIASHTTGIATTGPATVVENYNLFSNVTTPRSGGGISAGANSIIGTAAFADHTTYQLSSSSVAIDAGTNAGITTDYFGTARPQSSGYDMGYAEFPVATLPSVTVVGSSVAENVGPLVFTVTLSVVSATPVTFTYQTQDGSATVADSDYTAIAPTQGVIPAGNLSTTISVNLTGDTKYELNETVGFSLSNVLSATVATGIATGTITNDDSAPSVTVTGGSALENSGTLPFTVSLDAVSALPVTFTYQTQNGTATTADSDYTAIGATQGVIAAGSLFTTINVSLTGDTKYEVDETVTVSLSNVLSATVVTGIATGTIRNDDSAPSVSIMGGSVAENNGPLPFTVTLSAVSGAPVTFTYQTVDGSATVADSDYVAINATQGVIAAGSLSMTISVAITNDSRYELDETVAVNLSSVLSATIGTGFVTGTIVNDDSLPTITIADSSVSEAAGTALFTVTLSAASALDTGMSYVSSDNTATAGSDYSATSGVLTITAGSTQGVISVTITEDALDESNETFTMTLSGAVNGAFSDDQATGTIVDNDTAGVQVAASLPNIHEAGPTSGSYTLTLTSQPTQTVSIVVTSDSQCTVTAGNPTSFSNTDWNSDKTITVQAVDDTLSDGTPHYCVVTHTVTSSDATYQTVTPFTVAITVDDNDTPGVGVFPMSLSVAENNGTSTFAIHLTTQPLGGADVTIPLASSNGADCTVSASSLTILNANWNMTHTVTVTGTNDDLDNPGNQRSCTITTGSTTSSDTDYNGLNPSDVTVTVTDDETAGLLVSAISGNTSESGGTASFTVRLGSAPTATVTLALTSTDLTEGNIVSTSLTFDSSNWNVPQMVVVTGVDDGLQDGAQNYAITGSSSSSDSAYHSLPVTVAVVNQDNDATPNGSPQANGNVYSLNQDSVLTVGAPGVLGNDTDPENNPLAAILVTQPQHGVATLSSNGALVYTPTTGYIGNDFFIYLANDGNSNSNSATIMVTVQAVTPTPTPTITPTVTVTPTATGTPTVTATPTITATGTPTVTVTPTMTATGTPTITATPIITTTGTPTVTATPTVTVTGTPTVTVTPTPTPSVTPTPTSVATPQPQLEVLHQGQTITNGQTMPITVGTTYRGFLISQTVILNNVGQAALMVNQLSLPSGFTLLQPQPFSLTLAAQTGQPVVIQLNAMQTGVFSGLVQFNSNDPANPLFTFPIQGEVKAPKPLACLVTVIIAPAQVMPGKPLTFIIRVTNSCGERFLNLVIRFTIPNQTLRYEASRDTLGWHKVSPLARQSGEVYEYTLAEAASNQTLDLPFPVIVEAQAALGSTVSPTVLVSVPNTSSGEAGEAASSSITLTIDRAKVFLPILRR